MTTRTRVKFVAPTWEEMRWLVENHGVFGFLDKVPRKWRNAIALAISVAKWDPSRDPSDMGQWVDCGLCNLYFHRDGCKGCILKRKGQRCTDSGSMYMRYRHSIGTVSRARHIEFYNFLLKLYTEEYYK